MAMTMQQYEKAIGLAQRAGDNEAAQSLIQEAAAQMTGRGSFMETLGAGMQDVITGTKQLVGAADKDEVREHNRIANMATGDTLGGTLTRGLGNVLATAPLMLAAPTVPGAMAAGAGAGLLMPTDDESTFLGKAKNVALGGLGGAAVQKGINVASPVLKRTMTAIGERLPGGRQRAAERAFTEAIPEAERGSAQQALQSASAQRTQPIAMGVSGAPITSGAAIAAARPQGSAISEGAKTLLAGEREALEAGGRLGDPIRDLYEQAAQKRFGHLTQEVGGDVPALAQTKEDVYQNFLLNSQMIKKFDPKQKLWSEIQSATANEQNDAVKAELTRIQNQFMRAYNAGDFKSLHKLRMEAFDDVLQRLSNTDTKAANGLRPKIDDFKTLFDSEMDKALGGGKWSAFRTEYRQAAMDEAQATAGNKLLKELTASRNPTPGGVPNLVGAQRNLGTEAIEVTKRGDPLYSPRGVDALNTVRREIDEQLLPYTMGPRQSATAQNLNPSTAVLARAIAAQKPMQDVNMRDIGTGILGTMVGDFGGGLSLALGRRGLQSVGDKRAINIAERLIQLHVDPVQAAEVLRRSGMPPGQIQLVVRAMAQRAQPGAAAGAGGMASDMFANTGMEQ